jgi:hypothetical protein
VIGRTATLIYLLEVEDWQNTDTVRLMPEIHRRNDPDYLRFRPYHAFTTRAAGRAGDDRRKTAWWRLLLTAGVLALGGLGVGFLLLHHR